MHKIFYIMGKSASGKDHIYRELMDMPGFALKPLILYTTRPMRDGEQEGREYYFTDEEHLKQLREKNRVIEERCYHTAAGPWYYFTADDGQIDPGRWDYLGIGTLESYEQLLKYFGPAVMVPIYIEVEDGIRLERALRREKKQASPDYAELCRRYLADEEDFSEQKIRHAGILRRFRNDGELSGCVLSVAKYMKESI